MILHGKLRFLNTYKSTDALLPDVAKIIENNASSRQVFTKKKNQKKNPMISVFHRHKWFVFIVEQNKHP